MRTFVLTLAIFSGALMVSTSDRVPAFGAGVLNAHELTIQEPPPAQPQAPQINVEVKREGGRAWYMSPVWMAIGAIAVVLVILLVVMASKGSGGTTVVRG